MGCRSQLVPFPRVRRAPPVLVALACVASALPVATQSGPVAAADAGWTTPTVPPRCTTAQADSGVVAGCTLYGGRGLPEDWGWPTPPFPEAVDGQPYPPAGWVTSGWSFNGSAALADWEALMTTNASQLGRIDVGRLQLMSEAMVLYEGFLSEVSGRGYLVRDAMGYTFRCTSTSSVNCRGLTRSSLSLHAYGLAIDMNSTNNPPRTYYGIDGATACATPMVTDMPQWMIETAERWGLYWGGYGWSSGCASPTTSKSSAYRDPTHFEFRGTPAQARAIAAVNGAREISGCVTVIDDDGGSGRRCSTAGKVPAAGTRTMVDTDAPWGAVSALVNLTGTGATSPGYVTAEGCGAVASGSRASSNLNVVPGSTVANLAVVAVDDEGRFCLFQSSPVHLLVDVQGYFLPEWASPDGSTYRPITAARVLDTRAERVRAPVAAGAEVMVVGPSASAVAVLSNLTVTETEASGYLTADSCAALAPGPQRTSNVNYGAGATVANLAVVPTDQADGGTTFCAFTLASTHLVTDVVGWFGPAGPDGLGYTSMPTSRLLDSRDRGDLLPANSVTRLQGPLDAAAVLVNLVLVDAVASGYATAGPCSSLVAGPQRTSNVNALGSAAVANLALTTVDADGGFCVYTSVATHLVVDLQGSFSAAGPLRLVVAAPVRELDTRS
jgi:D-alanyl-D-alanine carboxypeptidase